ncbi:MAG: sulfite exporter TauE/SafE family protein [Verrucomicrobia bacterium]|nr:sulfite exporter TauE/SafE family protein [Verrucomicrobiota bacterium]
MASVAILVVAGVIAGIMNAVAGGGTFLTFPALVFTGLDSVAANQTSTIGVWPGQLASFFAYSKILATERRLMVTLGLTSLIGGSIGALILLATPVAAFDRLVPWLLLFATLTFAFGNQLRQRLGLRLTHGPHHSISASSLVKASILQFAIGIYGGFYGAGAGILELAVLDLLGLENIHLANAFKVILTTAFNTLAVVIFIFAGKVNWPAALITAASTVVGGYGGAYVAQRMRPSTVRGFVIAIGIIMTAWFFFRSR